jgi:DNA-binding transcriptional regulator YiaG
MVSDNDNVASDGSEQENVAIRQLRCEMGLMSEDELAALLQVQPATLATWRMEKRGPDFIKATKTVLYYRKHVDTWLSCNVVQTNRTMQDRA